MGTDGWMGGWIFQWTHGWVDGCVNERMARRMDGAHKIPEAFCSPLSSELSYSSCLFPEPSNRRLNFQVCLMWGWAAGMDRYGCVSSLPPAALGNRDPCPLERALTRPVRQPPGPPCRTDAEQSLGCLSRASSPSKLGVYLCNTSGLMETRCDQTVVWAALECWNTELDNFYGCSHSATPP